MLEALALRESKLNRVVDHGVIGIVGILGDQNCAFDAVDELLDQGATVGLHHDAGLLEQRGLIVDLRLRGQADTGVARGMLDEERKPQLTSGSFDIG